MSIIEAQRVEVVQKVASLVKRSAPRARGAGPSAVIEASRRRRLNGVTQEWESASGEVLVRAGAEDEPVTMVLELLEPRGSIGVYVAPGQVLIRVASLPPTLRNALVGHTVVTLATVIAVAGGEGVQL